MPRSCSRLLLVLAVAAVAVGVLGMHGVHGLHPHAPTAAHAAHSAHGAHPVLPDASPVDADGPHAGHGAPASHGDHGSALVHLCLWTLVGLGAVVTLFARRAASRDLWGPLRRAPTRVGTLLTAVVPARPPDLVALGVART